MKCKDYDVLRTRGKDSREVIFGPSFNALEGPPLVSHWLSTFHVHLIVELGLHLRIRITIGTDGVLYETR